MDLIKRLNLGLVWQREFRKMRGELASYSARGLEADLRLNHSDIPGVAAEAADERVAAFVRDNPSYRGAWAGRGRGTVFGRAVAG